MRTSLVTRYNLGFVVLLVLAVALCLVQTAAILRFRDPSPTVTVRVGEPVEVAGVRLTLDRFDVAPQLPGKAGKAGMADQGTAVALPGAVLVAVTLAVEVTDPARDRSRLSCYLTLVDDQGRRWTTDHAVASRIELPERISCGDTKTNPVVPKQPYAVGAAFTVPADAAEGIRLRLELEADQVLVEFAR